MIGNAATGDNPLLFTGGELISQHYLDSLVIDITQLIQRKQRICHKSNSESQSLTPLRIGTLVTLFRLPLETMTSLVKTHFPNEKSFFSSALQTSSVSSSHDNDKKNHKKKKKEKTTSTNTATLAAKDTLSAPTVNTSEGNTFQIQAAKAAVYGFCLGSVLPVPLTTILSAVESPGLTDEASLLSVLHDMTMTTPTQTVSASSCNLTHQYQLPGVCNNKEYIPHIFANQQRIQVDDYFRSNSLISFAHLQSLHIQSKQLEYLTSSFPNAIGLKTCILSGTLQEVFMSSIDEVTAAFPFSNSNSVNCGENANTSLPPWLNLASALPSELTESDIETLLKASGSDLNSKSW